MEPSARTMIRPRSNRLLMAFAAAWVLLSLAIGGAVQPDVADAGQQRSAASIAQP